MKLVTAAQMRQIDRRASAECGVPETVLMENAGAALAEQALLMLGAVGPSSPGGSAGPVAVVCGPGNNGGDGFAATRALYARGVEAVICLAVGRGSFTGAAKAHLRMAERAGVPVADLSTPGRLSRANPALSGAALIIDALFGTGLSRDVGGHLAEVVSAINGSPALVLSADLPSGIDGDTGLPRGEAVIADATVTFGLPKAGLFLGQGTEFAGQIVVADIGIPEAAAGGIDLPGELLDQSSVLAAFPLRAPDSHKGDFGHLLVVAGSVGKVGAGVLACQGALRAGAGLVTCALPATAVHAPLSILPEIMTAALPETDQGTLAWSGRGAAAALAKEQDALVIGPGLGGSEETDRLVRDLLAGCPGPAVVDADALNAHSGARGGGLASLLPRGDRTVLTPHPGEMARLLGSGVAEVQSDRVGAALRCAKASGCTVVLKGARTLVASPDGRWSLNPTGNPGMASAGTGDVLAGMIGALLARGVSPPCAAQAAVYLHGLAGDLAAEEGTEESMTAQDLLRHIGPALRRVREGSDPC